jgi:hypothetical protein
MMERAEMPRKRSIDRSGLSLPPGTAGDERTASWKRAQYGAYAMGKQTGKAHESDPNAKDMIEGVFAVKKGLYETLF